MRRIIFTFFLLTSALWAQGGVIGPKGVVGPNGTIGFGSSGGSTTFTGGGLCSSGTTNCAVTLSPAAGYVAGQVLVCFVGSNTFAGNTLSCTDSNSDTFTCGTVQVNGTAEQGRICVATAGTTNASGTITPTVSNATNFMEGAAAVFTSSHTVVDQQPCGANFTVTSNVTTGACTTVSASEILISAFGFSTGTGGGYSYGGGWTVVTGNFATGSNSAGMMYQVVSSTGTYTGTATALASATVTGIGVMTTLQ